MLLLHKIIYKYIFNIHMKDYKLKKKILIKKLHKYNNMLNKSLSFCPKITNKKKQKDKTKNKKKNAYIVI